MFPTTQWIIMNNPGSALPRLIGLTFPSMPLIPSPASSTVAYLTKPNPLEYPDILSVMTLAAITVTTGFSSSTKKNELERLEPLTFSNLTKFREGFPQYIRCRALIQTCIGTIVCY